MIKSFIIFLFMIELSIGQDIYAFQAKSFRVITTPMNMIWMKNDTTGTCIEWKQFVLEGKNSIYFLYWMTEEEISEGSYNIYFNWNLYVENFWVGPKEKERMRIRKLFLQ